MTQYPVFLLPLIALAMVVFLPIFGKNAAASTSIKSRRRRKTLLLRLTVLALLLATLMTLIWPFEGVNSLVQGLLFAAAMIIPAYLAHLVVSLQQGGQRRETIALGDDNEEEYAEPAHFDRGQSEQAVAARRASAERSANMSTSSALMGGEPSRESAREPVAETVRVVRKPDLEPAGESARGSAREPVRELDLEPASESERDSLNELNLESVGDSAGDFVRDSTNGITGVAAAAAGAVVAAGAGAVAAADSAADQVGSVKNIDAQITPNRPVLDASDADMPLLNTFDSLHGKQTVGAQRLATDLDTEDFDNPEYGGDSSSSELQDQLERVSDLVESHDLSDEEFVPADDNNSWLKIRQSHDRHSSQSTDLVSVEGVPSDLTKMTNSEITQLVSTLKRDKTRLQKLVIAQQAAIESERKAHDQSRTVARDAIKIMRDARDAQKFAEKLARRERSERRRLEQQYKKVASALDNAMSIIESRKSNAPEDVTA